MLVIFFIDITGIVCHLRPLWIVSWVTVSTARGLQFIWYGTFFIVKMPVGIPMRINYALIYIAYINYVEF